MRNLGADAVIGDVRRPDALAREMAGCDAVLHLAQFFDFWARSPAIFEAVNVAGAKHTVTAALVARVPRFVFCSSAVTIGEFPGDEGTEWTRHRGYTLTDFERSKLEAERFVARSRGKGIEVVTVHPGLVLASGDTGWTGRLVAGAITGRGRFASEAPMGWVWAADAARGIVLALDRGTSGERYILSGDTLSPREMLTKVAKLAGRPGPGRLPPAAGVGATIAAALARVTGRRPPLSPDEARFLRNGFRVDGMYAAHELGLEYTPLPKYLPGVVSSYRKALGRFAA